MKTPFRRRSGFMLIEVIAAIGLLAVFLGIATSLSRSTLRLGNDSWRMTNRNEEMDSALRAMRRDVWDARNIRVNDIHSIQIVAGDGSNVAWTITADGDVTRTDRTGQRAQWLAIGGDWNFSSDGASVSIQDVKAQSLPTLRMASALGIWEGGR